ncbi:MAG TPA: dinitrogenase iron-molybdenum cofactor biosynthesis protein [Candidatus Aminicenantes bacterium]|nr:dinitrogenase iron-molybdenum cofactor biosynthesis protein [Candidatus Aminicenantes bacterium]
MLLSSVCEPGGKSRPPPTKKERRMNLAVSVWQGRVAPLFDVSRCFLLAKVESGRVMSNREVLLEEVDPWERVPRLRALGVTTLICGAVSRQLQHQAAAAGIHVIPFVAGGVEGVVDAWLQGRLERDDFRMPGCGMRRRQRGGRGRWRS